MLASALGPLVIARAATADAVLNAFVAGALFAFHRHLATRRAAISSRPSRGWVWASSPRARSRWRCRRWRSARIASSRREWLRPLRLLRDPLAWVVLLAIACVCMSLE
jgi:hypothetical protein